MLDAGWRGSVGGTDFSPYRHVADGLKSIPRGFVRPNSFFFFSVRPYSAGFASPRVCKLLTTPKLASRGEAKLVGLRLGVRAVFTRGSGDTGQKSVVG
jgi:hypothetical protein